MSNIHKHNMKLYPIYRMFGVDLLFLYAIKFLFSMQVKGINAADIILSTSFYSFFAIFMQFPISILVDKIGYKKSIMISNIGNFIYIILIMLSTNLTSLIIAEFISSICFALKDIAEPNMLTMSIPDTDKKSDIFSKLEGKAISRYFYLDAIFAILSGWFYTINPYIPLAFSAFFALIALFLSTRFKEVSTQNEQITDTREYLHTYLKDLKVSFSFIFRSKRLMSLFLFTGLLWGCFIAISNYRTSLLDSLGLSAQWITIIVAMIGILSGIGSRKQLTFHKRFRNHSLKIIGITTTVCFFVQGLCTLIHLPYSITIIIVVFTFLIIGLMKGFYELVKRYLGNFANNEILPKLYTSKNMIVNIFRTFAEFAGSMLLRVVNINIAVTIAGGVFIVLLLPILYFMKNSIGLKPEQYPETEIRFKVLH